MTESHHIWLRHVTYEWVMSHVTDSKSHMTESWHVYRVMSHMTEVDLVWLRHATDDWVMVDASRTHVCPWGMSQKTWGMSNMTGSSPIRLSLDIWLRKVSYDWGMSQMTESWLTRHELMCVTESRPIWLIHVLYVTNLVLFSHKLRCWRVTNSCVSLSHVPYDWSMSPMSRITYYSVTYSSVKASRTHVCHWVMYHMTDPCPSFHESYIIQP